MVCTYSLLVIHADEDPRDVEPTIFFNIQAKSYFSTLKRKADIALIVPTITITTIVRSYMAPLMLTPMIVLHSIVASHVV